MRLPTVDGKHGRGCAYGKQDRRDATYGGHGRSVIFIILDIIELYLLFRLKKKNQVSQ